MLPSIQPQSPGSPSRAQGEAPKLSVRESRKIAAAKAELREREQLSAALLSERKEKAKREKELRVQRRKLVQKLVSRPRDKKSLIALIDVAYELEDYFQSCTVIKRLCERFPEAKTFDLLIKLGRCYLRRWKRDGTRAELDEAFSAYKDALSNPEELTRPLATPIPYLEFAGICMRVDKHQLALDTLGALMSRWKEDYNTLVLCQYVMRIDICMFRGLILYTDVVVIHI